MKKPVKFNKNWDVIIPVIIAFFSILCEIVLIVLAIKNQTVSIDSYIMQCYCCIFWTLSTVCFYINKME